MTGLKNGQKTLIIRCGKRENCIEEHKAVLKEEGYCWFGKIGVVPSTKVMQAVLEEENPIIVLHSKGSAYAATVSEISYEKPRSGYPEYYDTELFDNLIFPKSYYRLVKIEKMTSDDMAKLRVVSSGSPVLETLNKSMSSFFFAEYGRTNKDEKQEIKRAEKYKEVPAKMKIDGCLYRKNGLCNRKGFVNYKYECERPNSCIGQKV